MQWWESEYGKITEAELAEVEAEHRDLERQHAERTSAREASEQPRRRKRAAA